MYKLDFTSPARKKTWNTLVANINGIERMRSNTPGIGSSFPAASGYCMLQKGWYAPASYMYWDSEVGAWLVDPDADWGVRHAQYGVPATFIESRYFSELPQCQAEQDYWIDGFGMTQHSALRRQDVIYPTVELPGYSPPATSYNPIKYYDCWYVAVLGPWRLSYLQAPPFCGGALGVGDADNIYDRVQCWYATDRPYAIITPGIIAQLPDGCTITAGYARGGARPRIHRYFTLVGAVDPDTGYVKHTTTFVDVPEESSVAVLAVYSSENPAGELVNYALMGYVSIPLDPVNSDIDVTAVMQAMYLHRNDSRLIGFAAVEAADADYFVDNPSIAQMCDYLEAMAASYEPSATQAVYTPPNPPNQVSYCAQAQYAQLIQRAGFGFDDMQVEVTVQYPDWIGKDPIINPVDWPRMD